MLFAMFVGASAGASPAASVPVLGHSWAPHQEGYGRARPATVFNGGDPTGLVRRIRWRDWGKGMAIGTGVSTYVWPGTEVADNRPRAGARIVAFHLGTCHGRPSYDAVEVYFPRYGDTFDPGAYINACTGAYVGFKAKLLSCRDVPVAGSRRVATQVRAADITCATARALIARSPARHFEPPKRKFVWRFEQAGFRCGSSGDGRDPASLGTYACGQDRRSFFFTLRPADSVRRR